MRIEPGPGGIGEVRVPCRQSDAAFVDGMTTNEAERLAGLRQIILTLKLDVLQEAEEFLRGHRTGDLWTRCGRVSKGFDGE